MNGVKNGITLVGKLNKYADEAMDAIYKAVSKATDPIINRAASIDFSGSYFNNPAIPKHSKFSALYRNLIADERAILGIGGEFPTGKKSKTEINIKELIIALGVLAAVGGGYAISKKYDVGMDDISATIAYLDAHSFRTFSEMITVDSPAQALAEPTVAPTPAVTPPANASVKETPNPIKYSLNYNGINIIGSKDFIKDTVMTLEYGNKFSPADNLKYTDNIKESKVGAMSAANGDTYINGSYLHESLIKRFFNGIFANIRHEDEHNDADKNPEVKKVSNYDAENFAQEKGGLPAWYNLTHVTNSEVDNFLNEFDFTSFEKHIQLYK